MHHAHEPVNGARLILIAAVLLATSLSAQASFQGIARKPDSDKLYYREVHCSAANDTSNQISRVKYLDEENSPIATKTLRSGLELLPEKPAQTDQSPPPGTNPSWLPEYEFVHHPSGFAEAIRYTGRTITLYRREPGSSQWQSKAINATDYDKPVIADAGFDQFIRDHLKQLTNGSSLDVVYLSAPRLDTLGFTLQPQEPSDAQVTINMYPSNFVIRLLVDPIQVIYNKNTGQLMKFQGLTNVPRNEDKNFIASIDYQYGENLDAICR